MIGVQTTLTDRGLVAYTRRLRPHLGAAAQRTAERVAELAGQFVPIDTGDLHDTIRVEVENDLTLTVLAGGEAPSGEFVDYADHVEYGTRHQAAQPYMTPAALQGETIFKDELTKAVQP